VLAVDMDHVQAADGPAEEGNAQQLLLEHIGQGARHDGRHQKGLVGGLVLAQQHHALLRVGGQVLHALHAVLDAAEPARAVHAQLEPGARNRPAGRRRAAAHTHQQDQQRVGDDGDAHPQHVDQGAQK